jgi:hypothetical protein
VFGCTSRQTTKYRRFLASNECADFQTIWDIADSHKHLELDRNRARSLYTADSVDSGSLGFGEGGYGEGDWGGGPQLVIQFGDGTRRAFSAPIENVIAMWVRLLGAWGM